MALHLHRLYSLGASPATFSILCLVIGNGIHRSHYLDKYCIIGNMGERTNSAGLVRPDNENLILNIVRNSNGIHAKELETHVVYNRDKSTGYMAKMTMHRILDALVEEGKIDKEKKSSRSAIYYPHGYRPSLKSQPIPTEFDRFVIDEAKAIVTELLQSEMLNKADPDALPRFDVKELQFDDNVARTEMSLKRRVSSAYRVVLEWERIRKFSVPRPWKGRDVPLLINVGRNIDLILEKAEEMVRSKHHQSSGTDVNTEVEFQRRWRLKKFNELDAEGLKRFNRIQDEVSLARIREWLQFYLTVIETVSLYCQENTKKPRGKGSMGGIKNSKKKDNGVKEPTPTVSDGIPTKKKGTA